MAAELATAYFSLLPSMKGTAAIVRNELGAVELAGAAAGGKAGAALGGGMVASFGKFIPVIGGLLVGGGILSGISTLFSDSVAAASDLNESANAVKVTFGEAADEVTRLGESAATRLGLSKNQFNQIATQFSNFATTVAGEGGNAITVLDELTTRGADFASVYNLEVNDALTLFQSGLAGETEPLRKFGIDMSAATVEAYAYANGIGVAGTALTEAEKVQARYGLLMQQTAKTQGDFANTSDGLANSQRILQARFEDARAELGTALLPALTKLTEVGIEKGIPLFEKLVDLFIKLEPGITAVASALADSISFLIDYQLAIAETFDAWDDGKVSVEEAYKILAALPKPLQDVVAGFANFVIGIVNPVITAANAIGSAFANAVNSVSALTGVTARFNKIPLLKAFTAVAKTNKETLKTGNNTNYGYASGGMFSARPGGHQITVGEGRYNEAVVPLRPDVLAEIGAGISGGGKTELGPNTMQAILDALYATKDLFANDVSIASSAGQGTAFKTALGAA